MHACTPNTPHPCGILRDPRVQRPHPPRRGRRPPWWDWEAKEQGSAAPYDEIRRSGHGKGKSNKTRYEVRRRNSSRHKNGEHLRRPSYGHGRSQSHTRRPSHTHSLGHVHCRMDTPVGIYRETATCSCILLRERPPRDFGLEA